MRSLIYILLFISLQSFSQEIRLDQKNWKGNKINLHAFSNQSKTLSAVFLHKTDSITGYLFDDKLKIAREFSAKPGIDEKIIGGFIDEDKTGVILKSNYEQKFHTIVFHKDNKTPSHYLIAPDLKGKKVLGNINAGNKFYYVLAKKNEPIISILAFNAAGEAIPTDFDLGKALNTKLSSNDLWMALSKSKGFSNTVDVAIVQDGLECDVDVANAPNKLYHRRDSLLLLMDGTEGKTQIFTLNMADKMASYRTINRKLQEPLVTAGSYESTSFNSYLIDNTLYYLHASTKKLNLIANDFHSGVEKENYVTEANDSITYKNTPIIQEGSSYFSDEVRELTKTKQLLRKITSGRAVLTGTRNHYNEHELTIGAYKEVTGGGGAPMMMGGGGFGGGPTHDDDACRRWKHMDTCHPL